MENKLKTWTSRHNKIYGLSVQIVDTLMESYIKGKTSVMRYDAASFISDKIEELLTEMDVNNASIIIKDEKMKDEICPLPWYIDNEGNLWDSDNCPSIIGKIDLDTSRNKKSADFLIKACNNYYPIEITEKMNMVKLKWQKPTSWSWETTDGKYYIETTPSENYRALIMRKRIILGIYSSLKSAKTACAKWDK